MFRAECLQLHYDLELCHLGAGTDASLLRCQRRDWQSRLNTQIQNIALELVVNIFRLGSVFVHVCSLPSLTLGNNVSFLLSVCVTPSEESRIF